MAMEFEILGPVTVRRDGEPVALGGPRQRALLALLLVQANEVVPTDRLIDELWQVEPPQSGPTAVQNQVWRLRKVLGADRIVTRGAGYTVRTQPEELDLDRFRRLVERAAGRPAAERAPLLRAALALWRGAPLADVAETPTLTLEAQRLEELRLAALEERVEAELESGGHAELVGELATLTARHPLRERLRAQHIVALYRCGRQAEALDVYRETRRLLADELGLEPGPELRELQQAVLRQDPSLAARRLTRPASRAAHRRWRPRLRTSVVAAIVAAGAALAAGLAHRTLSGHAAATVRPRPRPAADSDPPQTPITIVDDFEDGAYDPGRWHVVSNGIGILTGERNGRLEIALTKDAEPFVTRPLHDLDVHYGTQCRFPGDFDARVEFRLLRWPRHDGVTLVFGGVYGGGLLFRRADTRTDVYTSQLGDAASASVAHARTGVLRLVRRRGISTAYVRDASDWVRIGSGPAPGSAVVILGLFGSEPGFGHRPVRVAFDGFSVEARDVECARR
jgi:DNA-binding SARP family transcriptional activator